MHANFSVALQGCIKIVPFISKEFVHVHTYEKCTDTQGIALPPSRFEIK